MRLKNYIPIVFMLMSLILACDSGNGTEPEPSTTPAPTSTVAEFQDGCTQDSDCVILTNGCCCDSAAVNINDRDEFEELFACEEQTCFCGIGSDTAVCNAGTCEIQ